ncbi:MAG: hypothetical protein H0W29_02165 [Gemmatimonadales bacterium]|nr:hypothetical protein [Gemmatimonadales bacterium]
MPVFPLVGQGARHAVQDLRLDHRLRFVESPRHANVLLLAGEFSGPLLRPAFRIHDQLPGPRATVWWPLGTHSARCARAWPDLKTVGGGASSLVDAILECHRALLRGARPSDLPITPDVPPARWDGVGPYGQGGKGMTGGTPYGRPLAGTAPDRDGMQLDQLPVRLGPFSPVFPPGLILDVKLQGDVFQEVTAGRNPFGTEGAPTVRSDGVELFLTAIDRPVSIRELELVRARHHLRWCAEALRLAGLGAFGLRALRLAAGLHPEGADEVRRFGVLLDRLRAIAPAMAGVGMLAEAALGPDVTGPVARASGRVEDARMGDPGYLALGFEPITQRAGDAQARWRQRFAETLLALGLAGRAQAARTVQTGEVESPWGRVTVDRSPMTPLVALLPRLLTGQEWGDAMTAIVSLDLDLDAGARMPTGRRPESAAA